MHHTPVCTLFLASMYNPLLSWLHRMPLSNQLIYGRQQVGVIAFKIGAEPFSNADILVL
jgi:hypothetical protein